MIKCIDENVINQLHPSGSKAGSVAHSSVQKVSALTNCHQLDIAQLIAGARMSKLLKCIFSAFVCMCNIVQSYREILVCM